MESAAVNAQDDLAVGHHIGEVIAAVTESEHGSIVTPSARLDHETLDHVSTFHEPGALATKRSVSSAMLAP